MRHVKATAEKEHTLLGSAIHENNVMSTYRLEKIFEPRSVALVGASQREGALGHTVLRNLREAGFAGSILLVNPKYREIDGEPCVARIEDLAQVPDLIVVMTPPATVPGIVASAGRKGVAGAVIITAGLGHGAGSLAEEARIEARKHGLRLVGPNCLGVMAPPAKLNASFAARNATPGDLALISQSGAVEAGLLEWAARRRVGFSGLVSLGDMVDVDFGDCLDYFAADRGTRAILLYIEAIADARKFMSAARAAARTKPVVVIKSGRHAQGARAAATHTGALAGSDAVYEAAFRRAGLLRVFDLDELFAAAETLGRQKPFPGKRLAILTNGGGIGVLAVDRLIDLGGTLAMLSPQTVATLDRLLPSTWSRANPVDIIGDADAARYGAALAGAPRRRGERRRPGPQRADRACVRLGGRAGGRGDDPGRPAESVSSQARLRGLAGRGRCREERLRGRRHPALRERGRRGERLHASRALSRGAGPPDGDAGQPAERLRAGRGRRACHRCERAAGRPAVARPARGQPAPRGLCHSPRAGDARANAGGGRSGRLSDLR